MSDAVHYKEGDKWYKVITPKRCGKKILVGRCCAPKGHIGECWHYTDLGEFWKMDADGNAVSISADNEDYPHPASMTKYSYLGCQITEEITDPAEITRLEEDLRTFFERKGFCV